MRVLFVIPAYSPFVGGAQTFVRAMACRLIKDGHTVTVLTTNAQCADDFWRPSHSNQLSAREKIDGANVVRLPIHYPWPAPYRFGLLRRLGHWLQRSRLPDPIQQPFLGYFARFMPPLIDLQSTAAHLVDEADLVHAIDATWDGPFTVMSQAAHAVGKPFFAMPLVHTGSAHILTHAIMYHQRTAYRQAAAVVVLTQREKNLLVTQGIAEDHIHIVSMGIDVDDAPDRSPLAAEFFRESGLSEPFVLFLGAATYDKGAFTLVRAVVELQRRGIDLWIACAGPQQQQLHRFIETRPDSERKLLRKRIRLLGIVDESVKKALLSACTALALPSRVDSFGIVLLESWLHGKPVIAAAEGGLVEVVTDEETGLLVAFDDVPALSNALARLIQNPALSRKLGEQGRRQVLLHYTWDHTYEALWHLYEQIERTERDIALATKGGSGLPPLTATISRSERDGSSG